MPLDPWPPPDDDPQVPFRLRSLLHDEVTVRLVTGDAKQFQHGSFDAGHRNVRSNAALLLPVRRNPGPVLQNVVGREPGGVQRFLPAEVPVVGQQAPDHIPDLMDVPHSPNAMLRREDSDIAFRILSSNGLFDQVIFQDNHLGIVGVGGEFNGGVQEFAQPNVAARFGLLAKRCQELAIGIQLQHVVPDRDFDASPQFAAELHVPQIQRGENVVGTRKMVRDRDCDKYQ